jgi:hypothetical protein
VFADETGKCMDGGQTLISSGTSALSRFFEVSQEDAQQIGRNVLDHQPFDCSTRSAHSKWDKQAERIAVALLSVACQVPLPYESTRKPRVWLWGCAA